MWDQHYNPLNNAVLSTIAAAIPVVTLLVLIASGKVKAHIAAIIAVVVTNLITIFIFTMPANMRDLPKHCALKAEWNRPDVASQQHRHEIA